MKTKYKQTKNNWHGESRFECNGNKYALFTFKQSDTREIVSRIWLTKDNGDLCDFVLEVKHGAVFYNLSHRKAMLIHEEALEEAKKYLPGFANPTLI